MSQATCAFRQSRLTNLSAEERVEIAVEPCQEAAHGVHVAKGDRARLWSHLKMRRGLWAV